MIQDYLAPIGAGVVVVVYMAITATVIGMAAVFIKRWRNK